MHTIKYFTLGIVLGAVIGAGLWAWRGPTISNTPTIPAFEKSAYLPGDTWADLDGDCQDTRTEVLLALGLDVELDADECVVISGAWRDIFTGEPLNDPAKVAIVRIVPLSAAHESGAWAWDESRKQAFANSFERAANMSLRPKPPSTSNLATVSLATSQAKGERPITDWTPSEGQSKICAYTESWITVKAKWGLAMKEEERKKVAALLSVCP